jgi:DUF2934 family protein
MSKSKTFQEPTREEIAACAYRIYEREGRPHGKDTQHWLEAEAQLIAECKALAGILPAKTVTRMATAKTPASKKTAVLGWPPALPPAHAQPSHRAN